MQQRIQSTQILGLFKFFINWPRTNLFIY